jgi:hypothetical protein
MRVLYKGYQGERAHTRQIIFNNALSLEDIVAVSGEKPPYMLEQEQKAMQNQAHKEEKMPRKKRLKENSVTNQSVSNLLQQTIENNKSIERINEEQVLQLQRVVGIDMLAHVISQCDANPTLEQVQTKLKELLA